jgi:hypothetical protein
MQVPNNLVPIKKSQIFNPKKKIKKREKNLYLDIGRKNFKVVTSLTRALGITNFGEKIGWGAMR